MTEQELREILGGPVEVPDIVEEKMAAACARLRAGERRPVRRRGLRDCAGDGNLDDRPVEPAA